MRALLAPSLLAAHFGSLASQIHAVESAGADLLHLDVMDGHFVPNISFGPPVIASLRPLTRLPFDTHLMIQNPDRYLEDYRTAGSDRITVHQEVCPHLHKTVSRIKELGAKAGVAINPATPVDTVRDILGEVDLILVMTVNPGFGGQKFISSTIQKIEQLSDAIRESGREILLEVDGGIDVATARETAAAGATVFVAGTSVFRKPDIATAMNDLRAAINSP